MYFLLTTVSQARGVQLSPANLAYSLILLGSTLGAFLMTQKVEGLSLFLLIPLVSLFLVWKMSSFSREIQTALGVFTAIAAVVLLFFILPQQDQRYLLQGISLDEWNKFRACVVALPCMCILLCIVSSNPSQLNLLLFGIPLVVCAGFSVYALRILLS